MVMAAPEGPFEGRPNSFLGGDMSDRQQNLEQVLRGKPAASASAAPPSPTPSKTSTKKAAAARKKKRPKQPSQATARS